jgi:hypothetical protein
VGRQTQETQRLQIEFSVALCTAGLVRYLAEYAADLPVGVPGRLVDKCGACRRRPAAAAA